MISFSFSSLRLRVAGGSVILKLFASQSFGGTRGHQATIWAEQTVIHHHLKHYNGIYVLHILLIKEKVSFLPLLIANRGLLSTYLTIFFQFSCYKNIMTNK